MQQIIALLLAFAAATLSLLAAAGEGQSVAPFGWPAVVVVYALATLPLAVVAARIACAVWPVLRHRWAVALLLPVGLLLAWWTFQDGAALGPRLAQQKVGSFVRMVIRVLWPLALQLPWTLLAQQRGDEQPRQTSWQPLHALGLAAAALAVAFVLPNVYLGDLVRRRIDQVNLSLEDRRLRQAVQLLEPICQVGATHRRVFVEGDSLARPLEAQQYWDEQIIELKAEVARLRQLEPTLQTRYTIAVAQRALDNLAGARRELSSFAEEDAAAALLMAMTYRDEQHWDQAERWYRRADEIAKTDDDPAIRRSAYDGLAAVAGQQRRFGEAEALYLEAIQQLPDEEAYFRFRLGTHYGLVGRPLEARRQWQSAARLDPERFAEKADDAVRVELNSQSPGCLLGPLHAQGGED